MNIREILFTSVMLFLVVGLPYLSRYMPYIRGKDDVSDPTVDPLRYTDMAGEWKAKKKEKRALLLRRAIQTYGICLLAAVLIVFLLSKMA